MVLRLILELRALPLIRHAMRCLSVRLLLSRSCDLAQQTESAGSTMNEPAAVGRLPARRVEEPESTLNQVPLRLQRKQRLAVTTNQP